MISLPRITRRCCIVLLLMAMTSQRAEAQQDIFTSYVFQGRTQTQFTNNIRAQADLEVQSIDRICDLDDRQVEKLRVAADADVVRFLRDCSNTRLHLVEMGIELNPRMGIQQEVWQLISPLAVRAQSGLLDDGSLFQKVVRHALRESQRTQYETVQAESQRRRLHAATRMNVADLENSMPLLEVQRKRLLQLLDEVELEPQNRGVQRAVLQQMEGYIGYVKLLHVDKAELVEFLDEHQLETINEYSKRYQGWRNMFQRVVR